MQVFVGDHWLAHLRLCRCFFRHDEVEGVGGGFPAFGRPFVRDALLVQAGFVVGQVAWRHNIHARVDDFLNRAELRHSLIDAVLRHGLDDFDGAIAHVVLALGDGRMDHAALDVVDDVGGRVEGDELDVARASRFVDGSRPGRTVVGVDAERSGQVWVSRDDRVAKLERVGSVLAVVDRLQRFDA